LALTPEGGAEAGALYAQLGEALANAGRVRDAAEAYSRAAALSGPSDALELRRLAAEQFLIGGRVQEGLDMLKSVLDATGLGFPMQSPHGLGLCAGMTGGAAYFAGEFGRARDATKQAERLLLEHGIGVAWELVTARFYHTVSLYYLGEVEELGRCAAAYLKDAAERGNRFAALMFRTGPTNAP